MDHVEMSRAEVAMNSVWLYGKNLSLDDYLPLKRIYNHDWWPKTLLMTGRQVSKSTTLAILMILAAAYVDFYRILYCVPTEKQMYKFSNLYVKTILKDSPILKRCIPQEALNSVMVREFLRGGRIEFSYTSNNADRIRGTSCDEIAWDEVQDIDVSCLPIVEQCLSASKWDFQRFSGTPKTLDNTIEYLWQQSSQNEWVMKCGFCNTYNIPTLPNILEMIGEFGPRCYKCKKDLDVTIGEWVSSNPSASDYFQGFHIPQIIVGFNLTKKRWRKIWKQFHEYPLPKFINEVLGISYDLGGRLLTQTELKDCQVLESDLDFERNRYPYVVAGVDWGISSENSYTVLVIMGVRGDGKMECVFHKKYLERDPLKCVDDISAWCKGYSVNLAGCDFGVGYTNNQLLRKSMGTERIVEFQYANQKRLITYNAGIVRYIINRTSTLNLMFVDLKKNNILFRKDEKVDLEIFSDLLAIYEEEVESSMGAGTRKIFKRPHGKTDDFAHAINFSAICAKMATGQLMIDYDREDKV